MRRRPVQRLAAACHAMPFRRARRLAWMAGRTDLGPIETYQALLGLGLQPLPVLVALLDAWSFDRVGLRNVLSIAARWAAGQHSLAQFATLERAIARVGLHPVSLALAYEDPDEKAMLEGGKSILANLPPQAAPEFDWAAALTVGSQVAGAPFQDFREVLRLGLRIAGSQASALPGGLWIPGSLKLVDCPRLETLGRATWICRHLIVRGCPSLARFPCDLRVELVMDLDGSGIPIPAPGARPPPWWPGRGVRGRCAGPVGQIMNLGLTPDGLVEELPSFLVWGCYPV